ncbi:Phosphatidylinositol 4-kinase gamma 7 [Linum grandiflorum]
MCSDRNYSVYNDMAVATLKGHFTGDYGGSKRIEGELSGRRRVFVQTESGFVLGIELDVSDNAHTVKRKLQLALNVPTEERSLIFGDVVLKNDLSEVRNFYPLLLTRNFMHRSSSSPCLSPCVKDPQQIDQSNPIEILGFSDHFAEAKPLVREISKAMRNGIHPTPTYGGLGGAYYFKNCQFENIAIVKPTDEEPYAPNNPNGFVGKALGQPGLKRSVRVGETGFREVAAYLLDYDHFASVPSTVLVKVTHSIFNINDRMDKGKQVKHVSKIASLQQYIPHDFDASDYGTCSFPVGAVHRIGILDVRILNTDRHAGNLLVRKLDGIGRFGQVELFPIDHGLCLPENPENPYFEWIHWPQASIPFSDDEMEYITRLDPFRDSDMLRRELPMIREACLKILVVCTIFLKQAASFGLTLGEIGEMMSREFQGPLEEPSEFELICMEAKSQLEEPGSPSFEVIRSSGNEEFQFDIDCDDQELDNVPLKMLDMDSRTLSNGSSRSGNGWNLLSKLEESLEEEEEEADNGIVASTVDTNTTNAIRDVEMPRLMKNPSLDENRWRRELAMQKRSCVAGISSGNTNVKEQLQSSCSFVKLSELTEGEWTRFLENFQKLLIPAFENRKSGKAGQRHRQRLGSSCQF